MDKPISSEVFGLLWDYVNPDIENFMVEKLNVISDLRRAEGEPGLMEEFAARNGITPLRIIKDQQGRMYLIDDKTGSRKRVYEKKPRYLRVVKNM